MKIIRLSTFLDFGGIESKMANLSTLRHSQMLMRLGEDKVNKYRTTVDSVDKHRFLSTDVNRLGVDNVLLRNFSFFHLF